MQRLQNRKYVIGFIFILVGIIYLARLFYVQIFTDEFLKNAKKDSVKSIIEYPMRGIVYDRNGEVLVDNTLANQIEIDPFRLKVDTTEFCQLLGISVDYFKEWTKKARKVQDQRYFFRLLTYEESAKMEEKIHKYGGVALKTRSVRKYKKTIAAHVLGRIGKVSQRDLRKDEFYVGSDYIGKEGIERTYEKVLRGKKGKKFVLKNNRGVIIDSYFGGEQDITPEPGKSLTLTLDAQLQEYGEFLMQGKKGAIVAIEPTTGEVLTMVSAPTYDPNLSSNEYMALNVDTNQPLFNRAIQSSQPPGSIVKTMQTAIALQLGVANENTRYACNKELVGCHNHESPLTLPESIQHSCNPYYWKLFRSALMQGKSNGNNAQLRKGLDDWEAIVRSFGFGRRLGIDIPGETDGNVPDKREYDRGYGKGHWNYYTIYSIAIGQGEFSVTPLQMANLASIMANKGHFYKPRLIKEIQDSMLSFPDSNNFFKTSIDPKHFDLVHKGMQWVLERPGGTARRSRLDSITICGKTGTSQNPHGDDHSVFMAFAPKENPKIAIAVFVENAGGGGGTAAPIASLMIEKYLKGEIKRAELEKAMLEKRFY